jgi:branched-chain amino acid transport system permease protein
VNGLQRFADGFYALSPFGSTSFAIGPIVVPGRTLWLMIAAWLLVALTTFIVWAIIATPWGRTVIAVRQDEDLARALGKNTFRIKVQVMVLGGVCAALAGCVLVVDQQNANPDNFGTSVTFMVYAIVILGGAGRLFTPIIGAILFWLLLSVTDGVLRELAEASTAAGLWFGQDQAGAARYILVGLGLVLVIVFRPHGLLGQGRATRKISARRAAVAA